MTGLEFTSSLVAHLAWPAAVVLLLLVFHSKVSSLIEQIGARLTRVKWPGGEAVMTPVDQQALALAGSRLYGSEEVAAAVAIDQDEVDGADTVLVDRSRGAPAGGAEQSPVTVDLRELESRRRAQIEVLIDLAAKWGWSQRHLFSQFPHPVVEWSEEGEPRIAYGTTSDERIKESLRIASEPPSAATAHYLDRLLRNRSSKGVRISSSR